MDPIPETARLLASLDGASHEHLTSTLRHMALDVARVVPSLVGLGLTLGEHGLTLVLVAPDEASTVLDGEQHPSGGPPAGVALDGRDDGLPQPALDALAGGPRDVPPGWPRDVPPGWPRDLLPGGSHDVLPGGPPDALSEEHWAQHAQAASSNGVRSTLSFPLDGTGALTGALTLYAAAPWAFTGREQDVRRVIGVPGGRSISNGDVPFRSLADARDALERLEDHDLVERAVGFVAAAQKIGVVDARTLLRDAAARAGVDVAVLARTVLRGSAGAVADVLDPPVGPSPGPEPGSSGLP